MKKFVKTLSLILSIAIVFTSAAAATYYFQRLAGMRTFHGRIESFGSLGDPQLVLAVVDNGSDIYVGDEGDVSGDGVEFPILVDAHGVAGSTAWCDSNGKEAVAAPTFVLSTTGGDVDDTYFRIELGGDTSAAAAMEFGVTVKYYPDGSDICTHSSAFPMEVNGDTAISDPVPLGDIAEGDRVEIDVSAWVMAEFLNYVDYTGGDMTVDVVFSANIDK